MFQALVAAANATANATLDNNMSWGDANWSNWTAGAADNASWGSADDSWGSTGGDMSWGAPAADALIMPAVDEKTLRAEAIRNKVNLACLLIPLFVLVATLIGLVVDHFFVRKRAKGPPSDRPRGWVIGMLVASYTLLLPGLLTTLFSYSIDAAGGSMHLSGKTENTFEFAQELYKSGSVAGCFFVVGFAMVIPVVKLVLLIYGGITRHSKDQALNARRAISFVQRISKWASPDMFAYILLMYLIRNLDHGFLLGARMELDIGFTCFATFCVASTISSLGVRSPEKRRDIPDRHYCHHTTILTMLGIGIAGLMLAAHLIFLYIGLKTPCMALRLDVDLMIESGQVPAEQGPLIKMLGIDKLTADDVNIFDCIGNLWKWVKADAENMNYNMNDFTAFVMIAVFVIAFTLIDMVGILAVAINVHVYACRPAALLELTHIFRKLSMLDVAIAGVIVIITAGKIYEKLGVVLTFEIGLLYLAVAELCHYVSYYTVTWIAMAMPPSKEVDSSEGDDDGEADDFSYQRHRSSSSALEVAGHSYSQHRTASSLALEADGMGSSSSCEESNSSDEEHLNGNGV